MTILIFAAAILLCLVIWDRGHLSGHPRGILLGLALNVLMYNTCQVSVIISATAIEVVLFPFCAFINGCYALGVDPHSFLGLPAQPLPRDEREPRAKFVRGMAVLFCIGNFVVWTHLGVTTSLRLHDEGTCCSGGNPWIFALPMIWNTYWCLMLSI